MKISRDKGIGGQQVQMEICTRRHAVKERLGQRPAHPCNSLRARNR